MLRPKRPLAFAVGITMMLAGAAMLLLRDPPQSGAPPAGPRNSAPKAQHTPPAAPAAEPQLASWQFGYTPNPDATRRYLATLEKPDLRSAAPGLFGGRDDGQPVLLYRALYIVHQEKFGRPFVVGKQGIGDCVSWGWKHGADIHLAVLKLTGEASEWREVATEPIYGGSRVEARGRSAGGWSDGSYGSAAAKWCKDWGLLFRENYAAAGCDLSDYSASRAKQWGNYGCGGKEDAGRLDAIAKQKPVRQIALVASWEEAAAAIASGYPVPVCSGQGFASSRTEGGWANARGSWSHCMCFIGVRYQPDGLLCLNSWGPAWISGPKWPDDQPDGSFWVHRETVARMLRGEDSFALSGFDGFPFRDLSHAAWAQRTAPRLQPREMEPGPRWKGDVQNVALAL